jgi:hypothetical protein
MQDENNKGGLFDHSRLRLSRVRLPARYWHLLMISKKITSIVAGTEKNNIRLYHLDIFFSARMYIKGR